MRIIALSDTHNQHQKVTVPDGDVLAFGGDITDFGELEQLTRFNNWLGDLPHKHKLVIAGNHDRSLQDNAAVAEGLLGNCTYLRDGAVQIDGLWFYGFPWTPWFGGEFWRFNQHRGADMRGRLEQLVVPVDILISHGPPRGVCDRVAHTVTVGCDDLLEKVREIKPKVHVFGHIHEGHGQHLTDDTAFYNVSICNAAYQAVNPVTVIDL
jgi:Icc-related predicted phosphoesterase